MCQVKVNVVTCEYIDLKIVPSPSLYMTNCSIAKSLLFFNNGYLDKVVLIFIIFCLESLGSFDPFTMKNKVMYSQHKNSNIRAHLMLSLGENIEAFNGLKKLEGIFIKKKIEECQSKQTDITNFFSL